MTSTNSIKAVLVREREAWAEARARASGGKRILLATNVTGFQHASLLESVLAVALTLRGADVSLIGCDAALPACLKVEAHSVPDPRQVVEGLDPRLCEMCCKMGDVHFAPLQLPRIRFSQYLTAEDYAGARALCAPLDAQALSTLRNGPGDEVGMQGLAGALRYFARGDLPETEESTAVLRRFVEAALLTSTVFDRVLARETFDAAVFHHGIYVPQGPAGDALRRNSVRVVNWNPSYRKSTFIFSHENSYHYTLMDEPTAAWEDMEWSAAQETEILDYLQSRAQGTRDWIWFFERPEHDALKFASDVGLDLNKPVVGMLSNVAWDAQLHFPANAFANIFEWVFSTIEYFATRPDLQLVLRIHPAEIRGTVPSRQLMAEEIAARYPKLPPNVIVVGPEDSISTYSLMSLCSSVIIFGTKMGVELSAVGKPVIVAGEAWVRNKGLTQDVASPEQYLKVLDSLPDGPSMSEEQIVRARKYAYHFFFRRMIPLPFIVPSDSKIYALCLNSLDELRPGACAGLDVVCDGILNNAPFLYRAEHLGLHA